MKVAQQPAMAYDKVSLSTAAKSGKSGLLLNSSYVFATRSLALLEGADASFGARDSLDLTVSAWVCRFMVASSLSPGYRQTWRHRKVIEYPDMVATFNDRSGLPCQHRRRTDLATRPA